MRLPRLRLGVLDFHPIQYHAPLYRRLVSRSRVRLDVLYLRDTGYRPVVDPGFGVPVAWNIDLLSGYEHSFLGGSGRRAGRLGATARLARWLRSNEVVVVHGHSDPRMLFLPQPVAPWAFLSCCAGVQRPMDCRPGSAAASGAASLALWSLPAQGD